METTDSERPSSLSEQLYVVVELLRDHDGVFLALDFDGTLADIESDPDAPTIPDETRETLSALAHEPAVEVAIVSGRGLADLRDRIDLSEVVYAGNHGLEIQTDEYVVHPDARRAEATITDCCNRLTDQLADVEGVIVENKGVTATVHYRLVADEDVPVVQNAVESLVETRDDVRVTTGKAVLELRPAVEWDKGRAVQQLTDELVPSDETWLSVYVGDDTTDESAFAALPDRGLAVKVGTDPDTRASYRVADPDEVRTLLSWLHEYGLDFLAD